MTAGRRPVSIICVFNDADVRQQCLDRSIEQHLHEAPETEYIPIDNVDGSFGSAGAALNHGASLASRDVLVFVHQDVYLHSLRALEEAAEVVAGDGGFGLLGAIGVASDGHLHGRIRDRVVLLGEPATQPTYVDSLDEVLFVAPRRLVLQEPLTESPEMAWHAYAVEYGLRVNGLGLRVAAINLPLTHNSLTTNLDRLDVAHAAVAVSHPGSLPVHTTCGTIAPAMPGRQSSRFLRSHRWRYRWLKESAAVQSARRVAGGSQFVLSDIRLDIDAVIADGLDSPLVVLNLDGAEPPFVDEFPSPLELTRLGAPVALSSGRIRDLAEAVDGWRPGSSMLLTNLKSADLKELSPRFPRGRHLIGFHDGIGFWVLVGPAGIPEHLRSQRSTPLGMRK